MSALILYRKGTDILVLSNSIKSISLNREYDFFIMRSKFTEEKRQQNMEEDIEKIKRNFFPNEKNEHYSIF